MAALSFTRDGSVARLVFQRPDVLNALDTEMARGLRDACRSIAADPDVRVVVMSGAGRAFVAGGDIAVMREDPVANAGELIDLAHEALRLLAGLQAPVVASLHGVVAGGGLGIALSADLAITAEGTRFNLAYANICTSCDCGNSWALPRIVGTRKALEIALLSDTFDAQEALRLGLVNRVVEPASLAEETEKLVQRLARGAPLALGNLKRLMRESFDRSLSEQLDAERAAFLQCAASDDFREGMDAFSHKRPARYRGS